MADNIITGRAKKFDGTKIDYVSIFNWSDGKCIAQVVPDASGNWEFNYYQNINIGLTYVADGCEPITHGPYMFDLNLSLITSGYLMVCYAVTKEVGYPYFDKEQVNHPGWSANFSQVIDISLLEYAIEPSNDAAIPIKTKTISQFNKDWIIELLSYSDIGASHNSTFEILDDKGVVIFALVLNSNTSNSAVSLSYGKDLLNTVQASTSGVNAYPRGEISFTNNAVYYDNKASSRYVVSFEYAVDLSKAKEVRFSAQSYVGVNNAESGAYFKVLRLKPIG